MAVHSFRTSSNREAGTVRLLMAAALTISCLASSILPLFNSHLADSGINLIELNKLTDEKVTHLQIKH